MIRIEAVPLLAVKLLVRPKPLAAVKSKEESAIYRTAGGRRGTSSDRSEVTLRRRPQLSASAI